MQYLDTVGNLKFFYCREAPGDLTLYAYKGNEIICTEVYQDIVDPRPRDCMKSMLNHVFDVYTYQDITSAIQLPKFKVLPFKCLLIWGKITGFSHWEYFKQVANNKEWFKHYVDVQKIDLAAKETVI